MHDFRDDFIVKQADLIVIKNKKFLKVASISKNALIWYEIGFVHEFSLSDTTEDYKVTAWKILRLPDMMKKIQVILEPIAFIQ